MATHQLPAQHVIDTSRYERVGEGLIARPLPNEDHARVQLAITILLREQAKTLNYSVLQEWTLDENELPAHNWMTPDVLVGAKSAPRAESGHLLPPAVLAVEILSPDQTVGEMRLKALRYFSWGVSYVWIIDPVAKSAVTLSASEPGHGQIVFDGEIKASGMKLRIAEIFNFD
jgi:Uma2 family endonuclease